MQWIWMAAIARSSSAAPQGVGKVT